MGRSVLRPTSAFVESLCDSGSFPNSVKSYRSFTARGESKQKGPYEGKWRLNVWIA
jgi:hypothetical protein